MTQIGSVVDGKYEILKQIGKGGMSVVYFAMDKRLNKQWAVKEIRKKGNGKNDEIVVNSLLAEANLMKKLDHPALPRIVDIIDNGETIYIVMDYIEGESLDKILLEYGPQSEKVVLDWAKQLCDVLSYLHSQKPPIIYRDMKPANVMLKPEGNLKVIDFGIAREYKEQNLSDTTVLGTKGYAPPEQYQGHTDIRSDIYALGMTMHHLLTGVDPRPADYTYAPVRQWNPELSDGIEAIIEKCHAINPEDRYQNCSELMYDLEHPDLITQDFRKKQKRRLGMFIAASALTVVMAVSGGICRVAASNINHNNYDALISLVDSTSLEEKTDSYKKAIGIYPNDIRAYMCLLDAYENEGKFSKEENDEFLALYNAHKDGFDDTGVDYAKLNYKVGMMYFNYYTDENGSYSFSNRVQKAYPFFEINHNNNLFTGTFEYHNLSECYYQICSFYKQYILASANVEEASKADYTELIEMIDASVENIGNAGAYDQLSLYNGTFMLMYDQRENMASVNVDEQTILSLMEKVYGKASGLAVQKEQSNRLKKEIIDNYGKYTEAVKRVYSNTEERK